MMFSVGNIIIYICYSQYGYEGNGMPGDDDAFESDAVPQDGGEEFRVRLPRRGEGELFGIADMLLGASRIKVMCADGKTRMARIPGKMKKRMWIREGDLVIIRPWKFQDEKSDVVWRYTKTQASYLSRRKLLPKEIDIF
jgi:translation initiation factor 1A